MKIIKKDIECKSKRDVFKIFPIGDVHLGTSNCAEAHFKQYVDYIDRTPNAYWFGGGDYCDCITPQDTRRFDIKSLADWMFTGTAGNIKERLADIAKQERERFCEMVAPIKDRCLGLIEGNHEYDIGKYFNSGHHLAMCNQLDTENLTDVAFIWLNFRMKSGHGSSVHIFTAHGWGGGRSAGAEPNHLMRLGQIADADILLRGHSHTFRIEPSEPHLCIPRRGSVPDECLQREVFKGNWGCWVKSYAVGNSTYDSRANYPPRPLKAIEVTIKPNHTYGRKMYGKAVSQIKTLISMSECDYEMI